MEAPWRAAIDAIIQKASETREMKETFVTDNRRDHQLIICYSPKLLFSKGIWAGTDILDYMLPLFLTQCIIIILLSKSIQGITRHFHQPNYIADILTGVLLGNTVLGRLYPYLSMLFFPERGMTPLDAFAGIGLIYFVFVMGLQVDLLSIRKSSRRALIVAFACSILCLFILYPSIIVLHPASGSGSSTGNVIAVSATVTAYPVLVRILAQKKLLRAPLGRIAMSASLINGGVSWVLFLVALGIRKGMKSNGQIAGMLTSSVTMVVVLYYVVRKTTRWAEEKVAESAAGVRELHVGAMLMAVLVCGSIADFLGVHAAFGALVMGIAMPSGQLAAAMIEKLEDFVIGFMMPIFFVAVGLKVDLYMLSAKHSSLMLLLVLGASIRAAVTYVACSMFKMSSREGLTMGVLLNSKGVMEIIFLHVAQDKALIDKGNFSAMIFLSIVMTAIVPPVVTHVYRPPKDFFAAYKRRVVQGSRSELDLRVTACLHTIRNVPALIGLLDIVHPTRHSPVFLYALQLVELTGRESALLIVHDSQKHSSSASSSSVTALGHKVQQQLDQIIRSFHEYEQRAAGGISVQHVTITSSYDSMHEDVCHVADDKHSALIILPYHKQHTVDGDMEEIHPGILTFNRNLLDSAPCSVGIFIDRGIGRARTGVSGSGMMSRCIAVLFIGGHDDREALSVASRMAENPGVSLTVIRFVDANWRVGFTGREKEMDDECVREFRMRTAGEEKVVYTERVVRNGMEMVAAIRAIDSIFDLYIVGRSERLETPLTAGMTDWADSPELGAVGDLLCSSDFTATVSLLVVQQYTGGDDIMLGSPVGDNSDGRPSVGKSSSKDKDVRWDP